MKRKAYGGQLVRFLLLLSVAGTAVAGCSAFGDGAPGARGKTELDSGPRPADACTLLTSEQVAAIVGTPGPFTGAHEDRSPEGNPVWGCSWGTQLSYAEIRELEPSQWSMVSAPATPNPDTVRTPLTGIGDHAFLHKNRRGGTNSYVYFATAGRYYRAQVTVDRYGYRDEPNAGREAKAAQVLAKTLLPRLAT